MHYKIELENTEILSHHCTGSQLAYICNLLTHQSVPQTSNNVGIVGTGSLNERTNHL